MPLNLDYFYGGEAEQYCFFRIPKTLFIDPRFKTVSVEAKVLYGLLLDRMSLSVKSGWLDRERRVFIYFTLEEAMEQMGRRKDKIIKLFKELEGIGLIERKKQGQGRPTRIYVKNFILPEATEQASEPDTPPPAEPERFFDPVQTSVKPKSEEAPAPVTSAEPKSGLLQNRSLDFGGTDCIKTEINKTDSTETDPSIHPSPFQGGRKRRRKEAPGMDEMDGCREQIRESIDYDALLFDHPEAAGIVDGCVEQIAEVCCSREASVSIGSVSIPIRAARERLLSLTKEHIEYVMECMANNTTRVRNIRAYTLTALYNAPATMAQYYRALVSHDMAQGRI